MNKTQLKQAIKTLTKARELLEPTGAWTKGYYGRDSSGGFAYEVEKAKCFCAVGAVKKAAGVSNFGDVNEYTQPSIDVLHDFALHEGIATSNDRYSTTHIQILNSFDLAILQAKDKLKEMK